MRDKIKELTTALRLRGMALHLDNLLDEAEREGEAIEDVLLKLLEAEQVDKENRALENRIKQAKLPWPWTLETFPFDKQPGVNKTQMMGLAKLNFIKKNENLIFISEPGRGKSGLAMGLVRLALLAGYRCRFYNAQELLDELYTSLVDRSTTRLLNKLYNYELLAIDELGYLSLNEEQVNMFFKLIDKRYQRKPTIITTNLDYEAWYDVFKHKELVDAMLDRFKHFCTTIRIEGPSLRTPSAEQEEKTAKHSK